MKHLSGCPSGDFGPCDCEVTRLRAQLASARKALDEILFGTDIDEMRRTAGVALRDSK